MNVAMKKLLALSLLCAAPAWANPPQAAQQGPAGKVQEDLNPKEFVDAAFNLIDSINAGQAGSIWDAASPVLKAAQQREPFIAAMRQRTATHGPLTSRRWRAVTRMIQDKATPQLPAGEYLTVAFIGLDKAGAVVSGTVSFRLEKDSVWRLAGYAL